MAEQDKEAVQELQKQENERRQSRAEVAAENFRLPDMGDFYLGAVDDIYLQKIDQMIKDAEQGNGKDAAFYTEAPPFKEVGNYGDINFVKAHVYMKDSDIRTGFVDGNTLHVEFDNVQGDKGGVAVKSIGNRIDTDLQQLRYVGDKGKTGFDVRLLGIDVPHPSKWCEENGVSKKSLMTTKEKFGNIKTNNKYLYDKSKQRSDEEEVTFVRIGDAWRECNIGGEAGGSVNLTWLLQSGDENGEAAKKATAKMQSLIQNCGGEVYFVLDNAAVSDEDFPAPMTGLASDKVTVDQLGTFGNSTKGNQAGYTHLTDPAQRFVGNAYIKIDGKWVNLAKAALCDDNDAIAPSENYNGPHATFFKPVGYDKEAKNYADAYFKVMSELDDRRKIQKKIFNMEFDALNKWTVTIGDVTLFVPPTNIVIQETIQNDSQPVLRAHGSMAKTGHHTERVLVMNIYFNEDRGINGYAYTAKTPNNKLLLYKLNGLRSLLAQARFVPFIPIDNDYVNDTLGIEAVTINALSVSSVPGFPRLYQATLQMREFNYRTYMPELAINNTNNDGAVKNLFSTAINWPTERYYYQRAIMAGDELAQADYDFNSAQFYKATLKNRTLLMPMQFRDSTMNFYIADQTYLDKMLSAKMNMLKGKGGSIDIQPEEKKALKDLAAISDAVVTAQNSPAFQQAIKNLNSFQDYAVNANSFSVESSPTYSKSITSGIASVKDPSKKADEDINKALDALWGPIKNLKDETGKPLISDYRMCSFRSQNSEGSNRSAKLSFALCITPTSDYLATEDAVNDLKSDMGNFLNMAPQQFFNNGRLYIPLSVTATTEQTIGTEGHALPDTQWAIGNHQWGVDAEHPDVMFLTQCKKQVSAENPHDAVKQVSVVNTGNLENLQYNKYNAGTVRVKSWSASLVNHFSDIYIKEIDGAAPQYLGGDDIGFSVVVETTDRNVVKYLTALPQLAADYARRYHFVMPCWPMRVDSEFTRFFGCFDMMLDSVEADTGDPNAKVFTLQLQLRSVDRTMRAREALSRIEADNAGDIYEKDENGEYNAMGQKEIQNYFTIEDTLAKAELYPDLELPTLDEMKEIGYEYIRYKFQDSRVYVDPDFYFIYPKVLTSQIIRETCMNLGKMSKNDLTMNLQDSSGGKASYQIAKDKGISVTSQNDVAKRQTEKARKAADAAYKQKTRNMAENLKKSEDAIENQEAGMTVENWDICDDIRAIFLEDKYLKEIKSFTSQAKARGTNGEQVLADDAAAQNGNQNSNQNNNAQNTETGTDNSKEVNTENKAANDNDSKKANDETGNAKKDTKYTEGKWVYKAMAQAREASKLIKEYLENTAISEDSGKATSEEDANKKGQQGDMTSLKTDKSPTLRDAVKNVAKFTNPFGALAFMATSEKTQVKAQIDSTVEKMLTDGTISNIFQLLNINVNEKFKPIAKDIIYAAACAASSSKEYAGKQDSDGWRPNPNYYGMSMTEDGKTESESVEDAVKNGIVFGIFALKMYDRTEIQKITGEAIAAADKDTSTNNINGTHYLLDPYYRSKSIEEIEAYKRGCVTNIRYCTIAFFRNMLFWLKRLIDENAIPSVIADVLRKSAVNEIKIEKAQVAAGVPVSEVSSMQAHEQFYNKNVHALDAGKIWSAAMLASTHGDKGVFDRINNRDYKGLNGLITGVSKPKAPVDASDPTSLKIRKAVLALVGIKRIKSIKSVGIVQSKAAQENKSNTMEKIYIEAAEDPEQYIPHSCHDMVVHDARGRMLRAFPTFYFLFVDEGRKLGQFKLHDNFYNTMAIFSLEVVKSRKLPADTATIELSNFYNTYCADNEDQQQSVKAADIGEVFDSIFSPKEYMEGQEKKRSAASTDESKIRIRPGIRVHLRMGYGASAAMLPVVFNGVVAECSALDTVQLVCQGDGIELMNPIMDDDNADYVGKKDGWRPAFLSGNSATPKEIMKGILTTHGGYINDALKDNETLGQFVNANPYGIYHFGNPDYKGICKSGETAQNIFEALARPAWGEDSTVTKMYAMDDPPQITFEMMGKTPWDCANICKSVMPDFICGVAPFGFRSTLFIGAPRYYYAYAYYNEDHATLEKRKPYQQYHIYTSAMDIVGNGIKATSKDMKTVALGLYEIAEGLNVKSQKRVGPLYADIDIYPEYQKTMVVNTNLYGKGIPYLSNMLTNDLLDYVADESGGIVSHEKIAWRMTASALKDSVKDMYCGDLIVLGDPTVKPHDRLQINDTYTGFTGQCTVKEVVHTFNINEGFITAVSPDVICAVDDPHETAIQSSFNIAGTVAASIGGLAVHAFMTNTRAGKAASKMLSKLKPTGEIAETAAKYGKKAYSVGVKAVKTAGTAIGTAGAAVGAGAGIGASIVAAAPAILTGIAITAGMTILTTTVSNAINRMMKNAQVLTIYPLKRYGIAYTAGVAGSKGMVYGSPSFNEQGMFTSIMSKLAGSSDNPLVSMMQALVFDDETRALADKYRRDAGVTDADGNPTDTEASYDATLRNVASQSYGVPSDYRTQQLMHQAITPKELKATYDHYAMVDPERFHNDPKLKLNTLISGDARIKPYMEEGFFQILHETPALNVGLRVTDQLINMGGSDVYIKAIAYSNKDGSPCYDLPLLNQDAINVLHEILRRTKNNMPSVNGSDPYEAYDSTKDAFVALKSALRVGDKDSCASTGFCFILEPHGEAKDPFAKAVADFVAELQQDASDNEMFNKALFECKNIQGDEVAFNVKMPSYINAGEESKNTAQTEAVVADDGTVTELKDIEGEG